MAMKKVGGPAMNVTRSRSTSDSACSGSKRRTSTARIPEAPGTSTPLSSPETWAIGAGINTASAGPSPCTRVISAAFQLSPRWVCSTALGVPVEPDVNSTNATSEVRAGHAAAGTGSPPRASASAAGSDSALLVELDDEARPDLGQRGFDLGRPKECSTGAATAPRRQQARVEDRGGQAVGQLPGDGVASPDSPCAQAPRHCGHERRRPGRRSGGLAVDHLAATGCQRARRGSGRPRHRRAVGRSGPGAAPTWLAAGSPWQATIPGWPLRWPRCRVRTCGAAWISR